MTTKKYRAAIAEMARTSNLSVPYEEDRAAREAWFALVQPATIMPLLDRLDELETALEIAIDRIESAGARP